MQAVQTRRRAWVILAGAVLLGGVVAAAPAGGPLAALNAIEPGEWQFRETGASTVARSVCLADPQTLIQLQHPGARCTRFVIDDTARAVTVHYTCPSAGHGRTTITVETPTLLHVQTQGIANGAPFDFDYQVRRTGACSGGAASR